VLVVALGRVNAADTSNDGLLMRNLFAGWPRERLAQVYSSGDNGDAGFFGNYYRLGTADRRLGGLFYRLKREALAAPSAGAAQTTIAGVAPRPRFPMQAVRQLLVDSGLYELVFRPQVSRALRDWTLGFRPEVILGQGYTLSMCRLPLLLRNATGARLAFFASDDWPTYLYAGLMGEPAHLRRWIRPAVERAARRLIGGADVRLAFGDPMAVEYQRRYGRRFVTLAHADDPVRFERAVARRLHPPGTVTLLAIGNYNRYRWPLLLDAAESCRLLHEQGVPVRLAVLSDRIETEGRERLARLPHVDLLPDPGNEELPRCLKGADVLLLAEGFDPGFAAAIRLSVSSKAHLFMFSGRPIVVYGHPEAGVCAYASRHGWARVVAERDPRVIAATVSETLEDGPGTAALVARALATARQFHDGARNRETLRHALAGEDTGAQAHS
jgi:glycosyltransferase involved in cell wall biosynthesis